jgi:hypothetical protein
MPIEIDDIQFDWVQAELILDHEVDRGDSDGPSVQRIQEWLTLNGLAVVVDRQFGPATEYAVRRFQSYRDLPKTGVVDAATFAELTRPLLRSLAPPSTPPSSFSSAVVAAARQHRREQPREIGGSNLGPWVRVYMDGRDGLDRPWCAGFACFMVRQAAWHAGIPEPIPNQVGCDQLSADAMATGRFISGTDVDAGATPLEAIPRGSFFVQRRAPDDWNHVGIVISAMDRVMETIEGNTNDGGSREGHEVCRRIRGLKDKDFITLQPRSG